MLFAFFRLSMACAAKARTRPSSSALIMLNAISETSKRKPVRSRMSAKRRRSTVGVCWLHVLSSKFSVRLRAKLVHQYHQPFKLRLL